jgi:hypothetical protein
VGTEAYNPDPARVHRPDGGRTRARDLDASGAVKTRTLTCVELVEADETDVVAFVGLQLTVEARTGIAGKHRGPVQQRLAAQAPRDASCFFGCRLGGLGLPVLPEVVGVVEQAVGEMVGTRT